MKKDGRVEAGCVCAKCVARRAYQSQWRKDQRALRTASALKHQAIRIAARRRERESEEFRIRERAWNRNYHEKHRLGRLLYLSIRRYAIKDPCWPWFCKGIGANDRYKLMRLFVNPNQGEKKCAGQS